MTQLCLIGGSGFIGTSLARQARTLGQDFGIVDIKTSRSFPGETQIADVQDLDALRAAVAGDVIVLLAAVHRDDVGDPQVYHSVNVEGAANVAQVAREKGITRIVFASSVAVYGFADPGTDETGAIAPFNDYGRSKAGAEEVLRAWQAEEPETRALSLIRPTVVFGPGNRGNVFNLLNQIAAGRFVMIGSGENRKSMAYVENVAGFFLHATGTATGVEICNYVDAPDLTMNALVSLVRSKVRGADGVGLRLPLPVGSALGAVADGVAALTGKRLPISRIRVKKFVSNTAFASARIEATGYQPKLGLRDALEVTIAAEFTDPDPSREIFVTE